MTKLTDIFESTECSRCGGSGEYSFNQLDGTRCYGCNGSGRQWTKADQPLVNELRAAIKEVGETLVCHLRVGDTVLLGERYVNSEGRRMRRWVEVEAIERSDEACGWKFENGDRNGERIVTDWWHSYRLSDGQTTDRINGHVIVRRKHQGIRDERIRALLSPACLAKIDAAIEAAEKEEK